jgi:hypothetical protein
LRQPTCCLVSHRSKDFLFVIVFLNLSLELEDHPSLSYVFGYCCMKLQVGIGVACAAISRSQMVFQWVRL